MERKSLCFIKETSKNTAILFEGLIYEVTVDFLLFEWNIMERQEVPLAVTQKGKTMYWHCRGMDFWGSTTSREGTKGNSSCLPSQQVYKVGKLDPHPPARLLDFHAQDRLAATYAR